MGLPRSPLGRPSLWVISFAWIEEHNQGIPDPDLGVFKALGAKDRDIIMLFIVDAAVLGFVGGFAG